MTGYTNENSSEFNRTGQHTNLIFLTIEPRSMSLEMSGRVDPIYSKFFDGPAQPAIAGLERQKLGSDGGYIEEDLYIESNSPYPFVTRCLRPEAKIGTPFCIRDIHIGKDLMLTYRFHIKYLPDWMRLDQSIRNFFNATVVTG